MKKTALVLILLITTIMNAQTPNPTSTVDVSGEGVVNVTPDEVTIRVRVENTGKNTTVVKQQNDRTVNDVLAFLRSMGIENKDVQTQYVNLQKNYEYNTKTYNYAANQSISIKVRNLSKYEDIMNGLLESGINRVDGVSFSSSEKTKLESQARKKAMLDAKQKATEYASALDQKIGKAASISEFQQINNGPQPMFRTSMMVESDASGGQQTLAPGEMEIKVRVNVSFYLY